MGLRLPLQTVFDTTHSNQGSTSVAGGWAYPFKVPQDTDNIVVKFTPSVTAGGVSVILQTSDDGGTTYFDVARTSIASANAVGAAPQWLVGQVIGGGINPQTVVSASVVGAAINGSAAASTLSSGQVSGLPILGLQNRLFLISTGNATAISGRMQVLVNSQSKGN